MNKYTRALAALLFALGMISSSAFAAQEPADPPAEQPVEQPIDEEPADVEPIDPVEPEPVDPVEPEPADPVEPDPFDPEAEERDLTPRMALGENVFDAITLNPELVDFHSAMLAADVNLLLDPAQEYTVFAVPQDVFTRDAHAALTTPDALSFYVIQGAYSWQDLWDLATAGDGVTTLQTIGGEEIAVEIIEGDLWIGGATIAAEGSVMADNGFVHVVSGLVAPTIDLDVEPAGAGG